MARAAVICGVPFDSSRLFDADDDYALWIGMLVEDVGKQRAQAQDDFNRQIRKLSRG